MRWSLLVLLAAIPRLALAEPKVAVAPLENDDGKVAEMVGDAVAERAKLTKPARVEGAMRSMGVSVLSAKSLKKLRAKLDVDVVVYGRVERDGGTKRVSLTFAGKGKTKPKLEIEADTPKQLRTQLSGKLAKRIESAMEGEGGDDDEDDEEAAKEAERKAREEERRKKDEEDERKAREEERRKKDEEDERKREAEARKKKRDDDERSARRDDDEGDDRRKRRDADEGDDRRKRRDDDEGDDRRKGRDEEDDGDKRKKKRVAEGDDEDGGRARKRLDDDDEAEDAGDEDRPRKKRKKQRRHVLTQTALWLDGGAAFARRTLTYDATGMNRPPPVGTVAPAGQIEGEVYPAAFSSLKSTAAGLGVVASYSRTFALGIAVPGTQITAPITSGHYSVGARYRFVFGMHSLAVGVGYWWRYFMADRSKLMNKDQLDMPDVDYSAIAPGASVRVAATPKIAGFGSIEIPLMLYSGPIQLPASYGSAKILAFDFRGGTQIIVADHAALEITAEVTQIGLSFTGQPGSKASTRQVSAATDRAIGLSATIGFTY